MPVHLLPACVGLQVWEGQQRELKATFDQLQSRLSALPARAPPSTPAAAAGGAPGSAAKRFPLTPTSTHNGTTPARRPGAAAGGFFMSAKASPLLGAGVRRATPGGAVTTPVTFSAAAAVAGGHSRGTPGGGLLATPGSGAGGAGAGVVSDAGVARVRGALEQLLGLVVRSKAALAELEGEVEQYKAEAALRQQVPAQQ